MISFVDSNIFIYAFTEGKFSERCRKFLSTNEDIVINTLVLHEIYNGITKITREKQYAIKVSKSIMKRENINIINFDNNLFFETIKRLQRINLSFNDVCHYTTAILTECSDIISYDKHFDNENFEIKRYEPESEI